MKTKRVLLLLVLCTAIAVRSFSQTEIGRQKVDQYPITDWNLMTYGLTWLPTDYDTDTVTRHPLIIFLHGSGEGGDGVGGLYNLASQGLPLTIAQGFNPEAVNPVDGQNYKFIVVSPQAPGAAHWSYNIGNVQYVISNVISRYRIDTNRIYVTGLSAGGAGTWSCVTNGPGWARLFAAIVPVSSAGTNGPGEAANIPLVGGTYGVKVWNICGALDAWASFAVSATDAYNNAVPAPSVPAVFSPIPGYGHEPNAWNAPYYPSWRSNVFNLNIFEWMLQYKRTSATTSTLPTANAGSNQTIVLPLNQASLQGTGTAAAGNTISGYAWTKVSGPAGDIIVSPSSASTQVTGLVQGTYVYRLTVTDNLSQTASSDVTIIVNNPPNQLPVAFAGNDTTITLPADSILLYGNGTDADGTIATYQWTKIAGPAAYSIANPASASTAVHGLISGTYQFELTVTDNNGGIGKDTMTVVVNSGANIPPVVNAGSDQSITLPADSVTLNGSATDADGTISSYSWSKISGPAAFVLVNASGASTAVNSLIAGVYQFELTVTDNNGAIAKDTVMVTVNAALPPANIPPVAHAGNDTTITLPVDSIRLQGTGSDADGIIAAYTWKKISGPASFLITDSSQANTWVHNLVQGVYRFELKVTDTAGASALDTVMITVNATPANLPPVAHAGADTTITLPINTLTLQGTGSDSDGVVSSYHWSKVAGPAIFTIATPSGASTTISNLVQGIYKFELSVTDDSGAVAKDTVMVTVNAASLTCAGIKRYMTPGVDGGVYMTGSDPTSSWYRQVNAGDTIVLRSQYSWNYFSMEGYTGAPGCPIVLINEGGQTWLTAGIETRNCKYIKITGSGNANIYYGFRVQNPGNDGNGVAISVQGKAKNVEVERVDVYRKTYGIWAKQDPLCDQTFNYPNYTMDSIEIHHCRFKNIGQDCIYAGNTDPAGQRDIWCNGTLQHYIPMRMSNVNIHHLIIDSCMRTGIQLSGADGGYNQIHDNIVTRCGYEYNQQQGTGIAIGGSTKNCHVFNNTVKNTFLYGILSFGAGINYIENNVIDSSGWIDGAPNSYSRPSNILASSKFTIPFDSTTIIIRNNKLGVNSTSDNGATNFAHIAVVVWGPYTWTPNNVICNNTKLDGTTPALVGVDPSVQYIGNCSAQMPNMAPIANAGIDTTINPPVDSLLLQGSGSDPDGVVTAYHWSLVAGPTAYNISHADSASAMLTNLAPGTYIFRLTVVDDDSLTATDDVVIKVWPPNQPPVINAGGDQNIFLPEDSVVMNGGGIDADGTIVAYHWTKISGPPTFNIVNPSDPQTIINGLVQGTYWFELTGTDNNGASTKDTMRVFVNPTPPPTNMKPVADAGPDITITLPTNFTALIGSGTDADGSIIAYQWNKIAGPSNFAMSNATQANASISNLVQGVYKIELKVTDNQGSVGRDTVTITVNPVPNVAPVVNAGPDQTITLPNNSVALNATASDADGVITIYSWTMISGPGAAGITNPSNASTAINGLSQGVYLFEVSVTDDAGATVKDSVMVTVNASANIVPVVNAGADMSITLPLNSVTLNGVAVDADGTISSYGWAKISGPASFVIANAGSASTAINNLVQGIYEFELTVTDNSGAIAKDTVAITVHAAAVNIPPVADAGADQTITLPANSIILSGNGSDADGTIAGYSWVKIAGPASYSMVSNNTQLTPVNGLVQGVYQFELTVTDNNGATGKDTVMITVNAAPPPPVNVSPIANAGADISITLPNNSVSLSGSGTDADGTIASYSWTRISGPASYTIVNSNSAATAVNNLVQGVYQFELTVTDNDGAIAKDTMSVTVNAAANLAPFAFAGADQVITLPLNTVTLTGNGIDVDGNIASYLWTQISGPAGAAIANATQSQTNINNLVAGVYQFALTVTDNGGATAQDTVSITVNAAPPPVNIPPVAFAGGDQTITLPANSVNLAGMGADIDGTISTYQWTKISGPAGYAIATPNSASTTVSNLTQGVYAFELTVTDNSGATARDTVNITVNAAVPPPVNIPPVANAGTDQTITLPVSSVVLQGSGTDADGSIVSYQWNRIAGPSTYNILFAAQPQTVVDNLVQGVYQFELTVTDNNGAVAKDTVMVTVNIPPPPPVNLPPTANAGADQVITLPLNTVSLSGAGTDPDGTVISYQWTKIAGPAAYAMTSASNANTSVNNLVQGVYQFELTVTDNNGASGKDTVMITVNAAPNVAPVADAGPDQTVTLPMNMVALIGGGSDADGVITHYQWTKISGPATYVITAPAQAQTIVTSLVQGVYTFELTVTDNNGATATDTVLVTVNATPNVAPIANAGADQQITLPANTILLSGAATDLDGYIVSRLWTKVTGPASANIAAPTTEQTAVSNLVQGIYQFEFMVTDNSGAIARDTMMLIVNAAVPPPANLPPTANAGIDQVITLPVNTANLIGSGTDADGTITGYSWRKISGPVGYTIAASTQPQTIVSNLSQGVYQFELTVTDNNGATAKDTVNVTVNAAVNVAPVANAGPDQVITLPTNTVLVHGTGVDADGSIVTYQWRKISGPSFYTIVNAGSAQTTINGMLQGVYQFELKVTDNQGASGRDTMTVTVNPQPSNLPPVADAGPDQSVTLPNNSVTLTGSGTDPDGTIVSYKWVKISGPSQYSIGSPNAAQSSFDHLVEGVYQFELTVTDNNGAIGRDTISITVYRHNTTESMAFVYPNPATTTINVKIDAVTHRNLTNLKIYDSKGGMVYEEEFLRAQQVVVRQIDVSKLQAGVYLIVVNVDINKDITLKFVKE